MKKQVFMEKTGRNRPKATYVLRLPLETPEKVGMFTDGTFKWDYKNNCPRWFCSTCSTELAWVADIGMICPKQETHHATA